MTTSVDLPMYLTRQEAAKLLRVCDATITRWTRQGRLVPSRVGRKCLFPTADLVRLVEEKKD